MPRVLTFVLCGLLCGSGQAATVTVNNSNAAGVGFNDTAVVAPVAGNPATTVGAQRLAVFQAAANAWGAMLVSAVPIVVDAQMTSLTCSANSATLGSAGATNSYANFPGAPLVGVWYASALANALAGLDLNTNIPDISANFNQDIGKPGCLAGLPWSYVIGVSAPAGTISFFDTVIHEIGHGLGFFTLVNRTSGALAGGLPDAYTRFLLDETPAPTLWTALDNAGRVASFTDNGNLTWSGPAVASVAGLLSSGQHASGRVRLYAPTVLAAGSSVSHWDTTLTPNEIMEFSLQSSNRKRLTNHLMLDLGWKGMLALAVSNTDGKTSATAGTATSYTMTITNNGPGDITLVNATVQDTMPAALTGVTWACGGAGGASCAVANGNGSINTTITVPLGGVITFGVNATIDAGFSGTLTNTLTVGMPSTIQNNNSSSAIDQTNISSPVQPGVITVSGISGNTSEAGGTATFTVVLGTQPAANVTIGLSSNDTTEGTVSPGSLVFTNANWNSAQLVTVTGVNDNLDDGDVAFSIITAAASSSDGNYSGLNAANVSVTNTDNDTAGITVSAISGDTTESGGTATFTVVLNSQPNANVTIGLSSNDTTEGTVLPASLVFTSVNWNLSQQVIITGVDDDAEDGDVEYSIITAAASSSDANYAGWNANDVSVTNLDDEGELLFSDDFE